MANKTTVWSVEEINGKEDAQRVICEYVRNNLYKTQRYLLLALDMIRLRYWIIFVYKWSFTVQNILRLNRIEKMCSTYYVLYSKTDCKTYESNDT